MTILEHFNNELCEQYEESIIKLKEIGAPNLLIEQRQKELDNYKNKGKHLMHFGSKVPKEWLNEEFISIESVKGPRGGKHTIINNKYKLEYLKPFHIYTLELVEGR